MMFTVIGTVLAPEGGSRETVVALAGAEVAPPLPALPEWPSQPRERDKAAADPIPANKA